ncbi:unnamed protein product [Miscanthus lutarioriparius]|uniref:Mon2/Sec7/BIG1-like dimerisation and cyclophilin-binding domain-containing protein n=1 Tax=Miscanthus lutarioriparius TaxID=422564 RepID=A0A811NWS6_9POAL|nr:unnamed protein product [Miscanthus lutarioriparius]
MAGAAGVFITRAFEAMLKDCAANRGKFATLQQSIRSYLESIKGAKAEGAVITEALASAGRVLDGPQDELVLQPLRLAVETKHVKLVEPALDCLHVITNHHHPISALHLLACMLEAHEASDVLH